MGLIMLKKKPDKGVTEAERTAAMLQIAEIASKYAIPLRAYYGIEDLVRSVKDEDLGRRFKDGLLNAAIPCSCRAQ